MKARFAQNRRKPWRFATGALGYLLAVSEPVSWKPRYADGIPRKSAMRQGKRSGPPRLVTARTP